jgi:uncharacterized protein YuzE
MVRKIKVLFDARADCLEVRFSDAAGYEQQTAHEALLQRVDARGEVIGFKVVGVSGLDRDHPLEAELGAL